MPLRPTRRVGTTMCNKEPRQIVRKNDRRLSRSPECDQLVAMVGPIVSHLGTDEQRQVGVNLIAITTVALHNDLDLAGQQFERFVRPQLQLAASSSPDDRGRRQRGGLCGTLGWRRRATGNDGR